MKHYSKYFILILLLFHIKVNCQNKINKFYLIDTVNTPINKLDKPVLDSILKVYHSATSDSLQMECLCFLAENLINENMWVAYCNIMLQRSPAKHSPAYLRFKTIAINNLGLHEYFSGNTAKAEKYFLQALKLDSSINNFIGIANTVDNLGHLYEKEGDIKSLLYFHEAIRINEKINNLSGVARSKNNLASQYLNINDQNEYIKLNKEAAGIQKKINDLYGLGVSYNNIGNYYLTFKKHDTAYFYLIKSLTIRREIKDLDGETYTLGNIGSVFLNKKQMDSAKFYFDKALQLSLELQADNQIGYCYENLCSWHIRMNDFDNAEPLGLKCLEIAEKIKLPQMKWRASDFLYKIYKAKSNYPKALKMLENMNSAKAILNNIEIKKSIFKQQYRSEFEMKAENLKAENEKALALSAEEKRRKNIVIISVSFGFILVLILAIVILRSLVLNKQKNKIIIEQKNLVEEKNKEVMDSINYAKRIQKGILPDENEIKNIFPQSFVLYKPKDIVSGDFYWFFHTNKPSENKNIAAVVAADCTGHGVPGAFMSMLNSTLLNQTIYNPEIKTPADALNFLNTELPRNLKSFDKNSTIKDGMDLAFCLFDFNKNTIQYSGANNPCIIINNNTVKELRPLKQAITADDALDKKSFYNETYIIQKNDCIYLFTDGFADQFGGPKGKKFKYKQLETLLLSIHKLPMNEQREKLNESFENWKGNLEQVDDVLLIGIKI